MRKLRGHAQMDYRQHLDVFWAAVLAAVIGGILAWVSFQGMATVYLYLPPDQADVTMLGLLVLLAISIPPIVTLVRYRLESSETVRIDDQNSVVIEGRGSWLGRIVTAIAAGIIALVLTLVGVGISEFIFPGYFAERITAVVIVATISAVYGAVPAFFAERVSSVGLLALAGISMAGGIFLAIWFVADPQWWQRSLSYLGSTEEAGLFFNVGLILTGLLVLAVTQETLRLLRAMVDVGRVSVDYLRSARIFLILIPVCLVGIGLFPTRISPISDFLHNLSSHLMVVFFLIFMFYTINRRDSFHPRSFRMMSRLLGLVVVALFVGWMVLGILNFVAFEIFIGAPIAIWLLLYDQQVRTYARTGVAPETRLPTSFSGRVEYAFEMGIGAGIFATIIAFLMTRGIDAVPLASLSADTSITEILLVLAIVLGAAVPAIAYRRNIEQDPRLSEAEREALARSNTWLGRFAVSATTMIVLFVIAVVALFIVDTSFAGVVVSRWSAILTVAVVAGAVSASLAYIMANLAGVSMLVMAGVIAFMGIILSAVTIGDPDWWQVSLSYLGSEANVTQVFFNIGLVLTGLLLLVINMDASAVLSILQKRGQVTHDFYLQVRWMLIIIPLGLMGVGLLPRRVSPLQDMLHNFSAFGMVLAWMVLAFYTVGRRDTIFPPAFVWISRLLTISVVVMYVIYALGLITYVELELLLFVPIGLWLMLFQIEVRRFAQDALHTPVHQALPA
jgi:hypothetical membrane protein